jgi:cytochrome c-type biogenesis protein CcmF
MAILGRACLIIALGLALYGAGASIYGARTRKQAWIESGRRAVYALSGVVTIAFAILIAAFIRSDFSFGVVVDHSSTTTPLFYRATAAWSSQEGSLLLWVFLLAAWSSLILFVLARKGKLREIAPYATAVLCGLAGFFLFCSLFLANPFGTLSNPPLEGAGLNPLLRHPSMMVHPPALYSGYTLFTVPFAFAVGALISGRLDASWITATRRFALAAWFFLGIGILLGARWSYSELGWGGYWAWDPVENASLMPWLVGTAFLHSAMIQEKRGMLKVWNVSLVLAAGVLAVLGTFLVRSGILDSIHAFGASTLGVPFIVLIAVMAVGSIGLVVWRRASLRSEHRLDSLFSRESIFLLNNVVLVGLCFVVFWGTFFPLISEAVTGDKASVGPPWFDRYTVPLALILVLLSGIGPVIAWRRATLGKLARYLAIPVGVGVAVPLVLLALGVPFHAEALLMFGAGAFALTVVGQEFWRGAGARRAMSGDAPPAALLALVRRNRRRYGGYLVHAGMAVLFIGVAASSTFHHQRDVRLTPGQTTKVGGYDVRYVKPTFAVADDKRNTGAIVSLGAVLDVSKNGKHVTTLNPSRGYYPDLARGPVSRFYGGESTSEVGLQAGLRRDLWTAVEPDTTRIDRLAAVADRKFPNASAQLSLFIAGTLAAGYVRNPPPATFRIIDSPLVTWIWIGGLIVVAGALIAIWPAGLRARRTAPVGYGARVARELGRA